MSRARLQRMGRAGAVPVHQCHEPGCGNGTADAKDYCPDHVDRHPYVQRVLEGLSDVRAQAVLVECSECGSEFEALPSVRVRNLPGRCPSCRKRHESVTNRARKARRAS